MLAFGIGIICIGFFLLCCLFFNTAAGKIVIAVISSYFLWMGIFITIAGVTKREDMFAALICMGIGGACFIYVGLRIYYCVTCIEAVEAVCQYTLRRNDYRGVVGLTYSYQGENYESVSMDSYRRKVLEKRFVKGSQWKVYVNPKHPKMVVTRRQLSGGNIGISLFGMLLFIVGIQQFLR